MICLSPGGVTQHKIQEWLVSSYCCIQLAKHTLQGSWIVLQESEDTLFNVFIRMVRLGELNRRQFAMLCDFLDGAHQQWWLKATQLGSIELIMLLYQHFRAHRLELLYYPYGHACWLENTRRSAYQEGWDFQQSLLCVCTYLYRSMWFLYWLLKASYIAAY